jgi:hypothetical protein
MLKVKKNRCKECLFGSKKIVSDERKHGILADCLNNDTHFNCHKSDDVCCKGFYDSHDSALIRISERLGGVDFVD